MNRSLTALAALFLVTFVTGCGQSGKLYVPGNPSELTTMPSERQGGSPDTETTAEEENEKDAKERSTQ